MSASGSGANRTVRRSWSWSKARRASGSESRDSRPPSRVVPTPSAPGTGRSSHGASRQAGSALSAGRKMPLTRTSLIATARPRAGCGRRAEVERGGVRLGQADLHRPGRPVVGDLDVPSGRGGGPVRLPAIQVTAGPPPSPAQVGELEGARHAAVGDVEDRAGDSGDGRAQHGVAGRAERVRRPGRGSRRGPRRGGASRTRPPLGPSSRSQRAWTRTSASWPARRTASWTASSAVARSSGGTAPASSGDGRDDGGGQQQRSGVGAGAAADAGPVQRRRTGGVSAPVHAPPAGARRRPGGPGR